MAPSSHATLLIMSSASHRIGWTALVLAGGRGSRLRHDDKAAITIGGMSALDHLLSSIPEPVPVVVAGPECPTRRPVVFRRELPLHGGPVAGIASGLEAVGTPVTVLLGVDMPRAGGLVGRLIAEFVTCDAEALVPVDGLGFRQPLCSVVRTEAMRHALLQLGNPRGRSLRELMALIDVRERPLTESEMHRVDDIDTPEDLRRARATAAEQGDRSITTPTPNPLEAWVDAVCAGLDLPADVSVDVILDVARVAARTIERPAAPVTTFLLGLAVAGGMDVNEAAARIQDLGRRPSSAEDQLRSH
jgi:molybdopterin-guanine dinucleotide biosynthesis protein A